jgi:hypothetical protein
VALGALQLCILVSFYFFSFHYRFDFLPGTILALPAPAVTAPLLLLSSALFAEMLGNNPPPAAASCRSR